ncbi:DNA-binding transcriptional regulator, XRE-family HTH domain [Chitinophaga jiangningensis]|uniref:DNA-binding transcriptional regulator, XRE-family HTH domain n=2 Tax=Chitinophaga jiangningensis TaxID=1419482 RepID=A0A1M6VQ13_9BACT|nr:DNA-binding transcriptional regulator, XRE-family HTH domain [Chitinophaga jiangningensis]
MPMDIGEIGHKLQERRALFRLRQEDLAEISGVGVRTIRQIEQGIGNPSFQTLRKLLLALGMDVTVNIIHKE